MSEGGRECCSGTGARAGAKVCVGKTGSAAVGLQSHTLRCVLICMEGDDGDESSTG